MDVEAEQVVMRELGAGERLAWSGRPRTGIRLTASDIFLIPFTLLWCGFAVFWESSVIAKGAPGFFALWGVPFVAVGLYMVFGRFVADAIRRSKTFYGLTAQRAIIVSGVFTRSVKSVELGAVAEISLSERGDRSGTITFGAASPLGNWGRGMMAPSWPGAGRYLPPAFEMIENAKDVYRRIMDGRQKSG